MDLAYERDYHDQVLAWRQVTLEEMAVQAAVGVIELLGQGSAQAVTSRDGQARTGGASAQELEDG